MNEGSRSVRFKATNPPAPVNQLDLFPERVTVERVSPRSSTGKSSVKAIFVVQFERKPGRHQVFHDRHGWYCAEHGPNCPAVTAAQRG